MCNPCARRVDIPNREIRSFKFADLFALSNIPLLSPLMDDLLGQISDKFYQNKSSVVSNLHKDVMFDSNDMC